MVVQTALEGRADFIITRDHNLLIDEDGTHYAADDERQSTHACSLETYAQMIETSNSGLEQIPDVLSLGLAHRPPPPV